MAQGLGFIEFSTGDVLSAAAANGYLASQTVMVFADAAARTAAIATPYEGMMSYLKDTNATEYYSGSAWVAVGGSSPLTTKGDLYGYSTGNARVPVGTNGQVLTADSTAATGVAWATASSGGMTLLSTTTLSGTTTSISSINQTYTDLKVVIYGTSNASNTYYPLLIPNGTNNVGNYIMSINNNGTAITQAQSGSNFAMNYGRRNQTDTTNVFSIVINNYASASMRKTFFGSGTQLNSSSQREAFNFGGMWDFNTAITSLNLTILDAGSWAGGTVLVYGVK